MYWEFFSTKTSNTKQKRRRENIIIIKANKCAPAGFRVFRRTGYFKRTILELPAQYYYIILCTHVWNNIMYIYIDTIRQRNIDWKIITIIVYIIEQYSFYLLLWQLVNHASLFVFVANFFYHQRVLYTYIYLHAPRTHWV